ncbi:HugZ family pyridoxamine 5'-phosphate oxidase [Poseidonibacter lekithochrous]|uniref:HugZ family pyridoxamine 5'-phosphate oxidase n=1 Tax=Poseidonibacter lekithochrous TaxID=1904463 RepID=UPI000D37E819|nr:pyridoxamine 5'-phosphate oxidase family protein [Poseidonibacter lekithochrous]
MKNLNEFIQDFQSLTLSTNDKQNNPFSSYAPFVKDNNHYYVFISDMAKHTHNLRENKNCSLFFIEDEKECSNIFARKRAMIQCESIEFEKETNEESNILELFENKFDKKMVDMLKAMKDFHIFQFKPFYGEATFGFGKAYNLGGEGFSDFVERESTGSGHGHK